MAHPGDSDGEEAVFSEELSLERIHEPGWCTGLRFRSGFGCRCGRRVTPPCDTGGEEGRVLRELLVREGIPGATTRVERHCPEGLDDHGYSLMYTAGIMNVFHKHDIVVIRWRSRWLGCAGSQPYSCPFLSHSAAWHCQPSQHIMNNKV